MSGLRERKAAQTRLRLLDALLARLAKRPLEEISAHELAEAADISDASFFNYFPTKQDLVAYFVQLWSLEAAWHARAAEGQGARAAIEAVFVMTARQVANWPGVMAELIVFQARLREVPPLRRVGAVERALRFPHLEGIEQVEATGFEEVITPLLERAVRTGELPAGTDLQQALLGCANVFFGVPLLLGATSPEHIEPASLMQLDLLWRGLTSAASEGSR